MTEDNKTVFEFGSDELVEEVKGDDTDYMKFEKGVAVNIEVLKDKPILKSARVFDEDKGAVDRYDVHILDNNKMEKVWSCSRRVVRIINEYIDKTQKFKIIRNSNYYDVIPLGLTE